MFPGWQVSEAEGHSILGLYSRFSLYKVSEPSVFLQQILYIYMVSQWKSIIDVASRPTFLCLHIIWPKECPAL